jgi:hypothetical protein
MTTPSTRLPTITDRAPITARDATLDDTIESSFPASDPPSSIPDPGPATPVSDGALDRSLADSPVFWASLGAVAISAVWLGLAWQRRRSS